MFRHERYSMKCDVYSFAMVCYEMFEGFLLLARRAAAPRTLPRAEAALNSAPQPAGGPAGPAASSWRRAPWAPSELPRAPLLRPCSPTRQSMPRRRRTSRTRTGRAATC